MEGGAERAGRGEEEPSHKCGPDPKRGRRAEGGRGVLGNFGRTRFPEGWHLFTVISLALVPVPIRS